jgi:hypothetical protein
MKTDRYTRVVLTFIAGILTLLACQNFFEMRNATASEHSPSKVVKVAVCNTNGTWCADILQNGGIQGVRVFNQ